MDGKSYTSYSYRLRASGIMSLNSNRFILQSFGGERNTVRTYEATTTINNSGSMAGANPGGVYISANWNRLPYLTEDCEQIFSGSTISKPVFIHETQIPGS
jgi:hypothetical protein